MSCASLVFAEPEYTGKTFHSSSVTNALVILISSSVSPLLLTNSLNGISLASSLPLILTTSVNDCFAGFKTTLTIKACDCLKLLDLKTDHQESKCGRGQRAKLPLYKDTPHWIIEDKGFGGMYIKCSACGARWYDLLDKTIPCTDDPCPVCGAQMDEDAKEYI